MSHRALKIAVLATLVLSLLAPGCRRDDNTAKAPVSSSQPRLVEYGSGGGCLPCKLMEPVLAELSSSKEFGFAVEVVDIRKDRGAIRQYALRVLPTQIFFDREGRELARHEGFYAKDDILAKWRSLGVLPPKP